MNNNNNFNDILLLKHIDKILSNQIHSEILFSLQDLLPLGNAEKESEILIKLKDWIIYLQFPISI